MSTDAANAGSPDAFGAGLEKPQFDFGFQPDVGTFVDTQPIDQTAAGIQTFADRLVKAVNKSQASLQTQILNLKESARRERYNTFSQISRTFGNLAAGAAMAMATQSQGLMNQTESLQSQIPPQTSYDTSVGGGIGAGGGSILGGAIGGVTPPPPTTPSPGGYNPVVGAGGQPSSSSSSGGYTPPGAPDWVECENAWSQLDSGGGPDPQAAQAIVDACKAHGYSRGVGYPQPSTPQGGSGAGGVTPTPTAPPLPGGGGQPPTPGGVITLPGGTYPGSPYPPIPGPIGEPPPPAGSGAPESPLPPGSPSPEGPLPPTGGPGPTPPEGPTPPPEEPPVPPPPVPPPGAGPPPPPAGPPPVPGKPVTHTHPIELPPQPGGGGEGPPPLPPPPGGPPEKPQPPPPPPPEPPVIRLSSLANCFGGPGALTASVQPVGELFRQLTMGNGAVDGSNATWLQYLVPGGNLVGEAITGFLNNVGAFLDGLTGTIQTAFRCADPEMVGLISQGVFNGFLERWLTNIPDYLQRPSDYRANFKCPTIIPSTQEAAAAWLSNTIDKSTLECWVRSNGNLFPEFERVIRANRSKLVPADLIGLLRRKQITEEEYVRRVRENGYIDNEAAETKTLSEPIPGIQDLVRFMVRDVADEELVKRFNLDADFDKKWAGKLKEWGQYQGFNDELALPYWIAHWEIPSPTQLYEMYHRLRHEGTPDNERVTEEDIRTALEQQDIAPYWIDRFLAISFRPLTRVDTRRAFDIGVLGREDVKRSYQVLGYDDQSAETLTEFAVRLKLQRGTKSPPAKDYIAGYIGQDELTAGLSSLGYDQSEIELIVPQVKHKADIAVRTKCIPSVRQRFLLGEFSETEAHQEAMQFLQDDAQVTRQLEKWKCERAARGKVLPLTKLSSMFRDGLLTVDELHGRLIRLNYDPTDAAKIISQLEYAQQRERTKQENAALKLRVKQEQKAAADAAKRDKKMQQNAAKLVKLQASNQKRYDAYRKTALTAALTLSSNWSVDVDAAYNTVWNLKNQLVRETGESEAFVLQVLATVAKSAASDTPENYTAESTAIVQSGPAAFDQSLLPPSGGSS